MSGQHFLRTLSPRRVILLAIGLVAAIALWIGRCDTENVPTRSEPRAAARTAIRSAEETSPSELPAPPEDPKLTAAKKHLPWASEENLKQLIKDGVNIQNIERGRLQIAVDLDHLKVAVKQYHQFIGEYPVGENSEVAKALTGQNPKKIVILEWPEKRIGQSGEFLDPWGTAYEIKVTAEGKLSIRSAGKDRLFWSADDEVLKSE